MTVYSAHPLSALDHGVLSEIAFDAVGKDTASALMELKSYAVQGANCIVAEDDSGIVGYIVYGPLSIFVDLSKTGDLVKRLVSEGVGKVNTACHVHVRRAYWKTGTQLAMSRAMAENMVSNGVSHLLLYGYATDQLAQYSLSQPGSRELPGVYDLAGRQVGVRDLRAYLAGTE